MIGLLFFLRPQCIVLPIKKPQEQNYLFFFTHMAFQKRNQLSVYLSLSSEQTLKTNVITEKVQTTFIGHTLKQHIN